MTPALEMHDLSQPDMRPEALTRRHTGQGQCCVESSPISDSPVTLCVLPLCVQYQNDDSQDWLQQHKLKSSLFAFAHKAAIDHEWGQAAGHVAARGHEHVAIHFHLHSPWAAHICQAQGQEVVNNPCLIAAERRHTMSTLAQLHKLAYHMIYIA